MSQLHALFHGWSVQNKKESDAIKKSSSRGGNRQVANMGNLHKIPGVKRVKRK